MCLRDKPTCFWPFIKPGGVKEREGLTVTDRALCGIRGGPHAAC